MEHHCGIYGGLTITPTPASIGQHIINSLHSLQHRGYEGAGVSLLHNNTIWTYCGSGRVTDVFAPTIDSIPPSSMGIGHVRYSTTKTHSDTELQPIVRPHFTLVHNGNIPVSHHFPTATTTSDTINSALYLEQLITTGGWDQGLTQFMTHVGGSYCIAILTPNGIYVMRDRFGIRPLYLLTEDHGVWFSSETIPWEAHDCDMDNIRAVNPGEILRLDTNGIHPIYQHPQPQPMFCSFELFYFMSHKSMYNNERLENLRFRLGKFLGERESIKHHPAIVCPVPNSSIPAGKGFAQGSGLPYMEGLTKRANAGRTFILPSEDERTEACNRKFLFHPQIINGQHVYIIDDSIVRGTTMRSIIGAMRRLGARGVHVRILAPPIVSPCYFGIDMSTTTELIAHGRSLTEIQESIGADSLHYISIEDMKRVFQEDNVCTSCFTGTYDRRLLDW